MAPATLWSQPSGLDADLFDELRLLVPPSADEHAAVAPFTGAELPPVPQADRDSVAMAAAVARAAQPGWAGRPAAERARIILRFGRLLLDHQDQLCDLMQWETGKARVHAFVEAQGVAAVALYYGRKGARYLGERRVAGAVPGLIRARVGYRPKGLVGVIAPWNYPLFLAVGDVIPALVAGNTVLSKADSQAPWTLLLALRLARMAGVPPEVWQVVAGPGRTLGPAIIDQVDYLCFTGSTGTGRDVARRCAERLIGCSLELGGKNPMIVRADADLGAAATGAVQACFSSAGQMCIGIERIYIDERVYRQFVDEFVSRTRRMRLGVGGSLDIDMGSLTSKSQLDTTIRHVDDALAGGATVLTGGRARPDLGPLFFEPTILADVTPAMTVCAEETFGPVVSVYPVRDDDEAITLANEGRYGLSASVWTGDLAAGRALAARIVAGSVNINDGYLSAISSLDAPMGGMRESGLGRRHGREGLLRYTEAQTVTDQRFATPYPGRRRGSFAKAVNCAVRLSFALAKVV